MLMTKTTLLGNSADSLLAPLCFFSLEAFIKTSKPVKQKAKSSSSSGKHMI